MDSTEYTEAVTEAIGQARNEAGMSVLALSRESGIPYSTLDRKLKGHGDFTMRETFNLAAALNVPIARFTDIPAAERALNDMAVSA